MSFDTTSDPSAFPEASAYFRQLVPMSEEDFEALDLEERSQAFVVSGAAELSVAQDLHDEIARAIDSGEGFDAFAKRVKRRLVDRWTDPSGALLETVFRTNVQTAYGVGRWYQQMDSEIVASRPFMLFDGVDDDRQSDICESLDGPPPTIKSYDDPFVAAHWPPLHHRCRSQWQSISRRRARALGGPMVDSPSVDIPEGFGLAPPIRSEWRPDPEQHDPALYAEFEQKLEAMR